MGDKIVWPLFCNFTFWACVIYHGKIYHPERVWCCIWYCGTAYRQKQQTRSSRLLKIVLSVNSSLAESSVPGAVLSGMRLPVGWLDRTGKSPGPFSWTYNAFIKAECTIVALRALFFVSIGGTVLVCLCVWLSACVSVSVCVSVFVRLSESLCLCVCLCVCLRICMNKKLNPVGISGITLCLQCGFLLDCRKALNQLLLGYRFIRI